MKKKTLDEIINNQNYTHINNALIERSFELAKKIHKAMRTAELTKIGEYELLTVTSRCGSDTSLYIIDKNSDYKYKARSLEHKKSTHFCGDFHCYIQAANNRDRLKFLNEARKILEEIDAYKENEAASIEKALQETQDL